MAGFYKKYLILGLVSAIIFFGLFSDFLFLAGVARAATIQKFYLHDATSPLPVTLPGAATLSATTPNVSSAGAGINRDMEGTKSTLQVTSTLTTLAQTTLQKNWLRRFVSRPLAAQTLPTGIWTIHGAGSEANASSNMLVWGVVLKIWRPSTASVVSTLLDNPALGAVGPGTTETAATSTTASITGVAVNGGDVLVLELWAQNTQVSSTAYANSINYDGRGEGSATSSAAYLSAPGSITLQSSVPNAPSQNLPASNATGTPVYPVFKMTATDPDGDAIRYKVMIYNQGGCSAGVVQTIDQNSSQTGWSGQNASSSTSHISGTPGIFTTQTALNASTTYWWTTNAIDPAGSNTWSATSSCAAFTTMSPPTVSAISPNAATNTASVSITSIGGANFALGWDEENGLVGNWRLDENATNTPVIDSSGNSNNGTSTGTTATSSAKMGYARGFNGTSDYISVATSTSLNVGGTFSVTAWVNAGRTGQRQGIFSTRKNNAAGGWQLEVGNCDATVTNAVCITGSGTYISQTVSNVLTINNWYHIVYTRTSNSDTGIIYVNGVKVATSTATAYTVSDNTDAKEIGRGTSATQYFQGKIDEVRLYNRALSAPEVNQLYLATQKPYVSLTKSGQSDRIASGTYAFTLNSSTALANGTFDITSAATGTWNVVVTNPDGQTGTLTNGFTVTASVASDTAAPTPNPPNWTTAPTSTATNSITMTLASTSVDSTPPIQYSFTYVACPSDNGTGGTSSGWVNTVTYTDPGLQTNQCYNFSATSRDALLNTGSPSPTSTTAVYTLATVPGTPTFGTVTTSTINLVNATSGNPSATPATYYAVYVSSTDPNWNGKWANSLGDPVATESWIISSSINPLTVRSLQSGTIYYFSVKARNALGTQTALGATGNATTNTAGPLPAPTATSISPNTATNTAPVSVTSIGGTNFALGWDEENGLVGNWRMDENATNTSVVDSSGNWHNGTSTGTTVVSGKINNGRSFNGTSDYIKVASGTLSFSGTFAITFWYNTTNNAQTGMMIGLDGGNSGGGQKIGFSTSKLFFRLISSSDNTVTPPATSAWHYLTLTRDSGNIVQLYIDNGVPTTLFAGAAQSGTISIPTIGANGSDNSQPYSGYLDEVRVYNRALSAPEVNQLYLATQKPYVSLTKSGQSDRVASGTYAFTLNSPTTLASGTFDITSAATGQWNVVVTNPDGQTGMLPNWFTVTAPGGSGTSPNAPTLTAPASGVQDVSTQPVFQMTATDTESNKLQYKMAIYSDSNCNTLASGPYDQSALQTGWSGQNAQCSVPNDCYNSGSQGTYTMQSALAQGVTYYWRAWAFDPAPGSNAWGAVSLCNGFTTTNGYWTTDSGSWSINGSQQLVVAPPSGSSVQIHVNNQSQTNAVVDFKMKASATGANTGNTGAALRADSGSNRYLIALGNVQSTSSVIGATISNKYSTITSAAFTFGSGTFYQFRGSLSGTSLNSWINGGTALTAATSTLGSAGFAGLYASSTNGSVTFTYDNFALYTSSTITMNNLPGGGSWAVRDHNGIVSCRTTATWDLTSPSYTGQVPIDYDNGGGSIAVWTGNNTCGGTPDVVYATSTDIFGGDVYAYSAASGGGGGGGSTVATSSININAAGLITF